MELNKVHSQFELIMNKLNNKNLVNIDNKLWVSTYLVTQKEYKSIIGKNPSIQNEDNLPIENITLFNAMEFCNKKSLKEGFQEVYNINGLQTTFDLTKNGYRLLTEDEWKFVSKGGNNSKGYIYSGSNNPDEVAWFTNNSKNKTHKPGLKKPNELGLFDMSGNVWEWVNSISGVICGGGYCDDEFSIRSESQCGSSPFDFYSDVGFRYCLTF